MCVINIAQADTTCRDIDIANPVICFAVTFDTCYSIDLCPCLDGIQLGLVRRNVCLSLIPGQIKSLRPQLFPIHIRAIINSKVLSVDVVCVAPGGDNINLIRCRHRSSRQRTYNRHAKLRNSRKAVIDFSFGVVVAGKTRLQRNNAPGKACISRTSEACLASCNAYDLVLGEVVTQRPKRLPKGRLCPVGTIRRTHCRCLCHVGITARNGGIGCCLGNIGIEVTDNRCRLDCRSRRIRCRLFGLGGRSRRQRHIPSASHRILCRHQLRLFCLCLTLSRLTLHGCCMAITHGRLISAQYRLIYPALDVCRISPGRLSRRAGCPCACRCAHPAVIGHILAVLGRPCVGLSLVPGIFCRLCSILSPCSSRPRKRSRTLGGSSLRRQRSQPFLFRACESMLHRNLIGTISRLAFGHIAKTALYISPHAITTPVVISPKSLYFPIAMVLTSPASKVISTS